MWHGTYGTPSLSVMAARGLAWAWDPAWHCARPWPYLPNRTVKEQINFQDTSGGWTHDKELELLSQLLQTGRQSNSLNISKLWNVLVSCILTLCLCFIAPFVCATSFNEKITECLIWEATSFQQRHCCVMFLLMNISKLDCSTPSLDQMKSSRSISFSVVTGKEGSCFASG